MSLGTSSDGTESIQKEKTKSKDDITNLPVALVLFSGSQEVRVSPNPNPNRNSCARKQMFTSDLHSPYFPIACNVKLS